MPRHTILWATTLLFLGAGHALGQEPPELPAPKRNAAKLAGLVGFVNLSCDTLKTDQGRFKSAVQSMGVDPAELDRDRLMLEARAYLGAYQQDVPASCRKADELFGERGRVIPGIFLPK